MIRIGIVDDDKDSRDRLKEKIKEYALTKALRYDARAERANAHTEAECDMASAEFESAIAYVEAGMPSFDMLFLDIDMPGMSGMELAEKIRETNHSVVIIFCTNHQQFAVNGYSVGALGFLVKPVQNYALNLTMDRAMMAVQSSMSNSTETADTRLVLRDGTLSRLVETRDICYVEVRQHYLWYNILDAATGERIVVKNRGTMQEAVERLAPFGFLRCSSSFLVNVKHINAVSRMDIHIGGEVLPIGRTFKESFMDEFSRYLAKKGWESPC